MARKQIAFEWEKIAEGTYRAKVIKGWLIKVETNKGAALTFLPDIDHEYHIIQPILEKEEKNVSKNPFEV